MARTVSLAGAVALVLLLSASSCGGGTNASPQPWNLGRGIAASALPTVPVFSEPKTGSAHVGHFSYGETVQVLCQTRGSKVHLADATSDIWYKTKGGKITGYVPSVDGRPLTGKSSVKTCG